MPHRGSPWPQAISRPADTQDITGSRGGVTGVGPLTSAVEILLMTLGYFAVVWGIAPDLETNGMIPLMKGLLVSFLFYFAYLSPTVIHKDTLAERGIGNWRTLFIRTDNFAVASKYYLGLAFGGTVVIFGAALLLKPTFISGFSWHAFWLKLSLNVLNALGQDLLFLSFFIPRLKHICMLPMASAVFGSNGSRYAALIVPLACALLFAIFHIPNPPLMLVVFILGYAVAQIFYHFPNLFLALACHAVIGTMLHRVFEMHMRIGPFFWESDKYVYRTLFPALRELIGSAF